MTTTADPESICDRCTTNLPVSETQTCEECGGVFCPNCFGIHECEEDAGT